MVHSKCKYKCISEFLCHQNVFFSLNGVHSSVLMEGQHGLKSLKVYLASSHAISGPDNRGWC